MPKKSSKRLDEAFSILDRNKPVSADHYNCIVRDNAEAEMEEEDHLDAAVSFYREGEEHQRDAVLSSIDPDEEEMFLIKASISMSMASYHAAMASYHATKSIKESDHD